MSSVPASAAGTLTDFTELKAMWCSRRRHPGLRRTAAVIVETRNRKFPATMMCAGSIFKNFLLDTFRMQVHWLCESSCQRALEFEDCSLARIQAFVFYPVEIQSCLAYDRSRPDVGFDFIQFVAVPMGFPWVNAKGGDQIPA